jgi:glycosyltransferase involved in cell wall biosynthesis
LYSVVVPAFNEEKYISRCLAALCSAMAEQSMPGEIIVVDNNSTDRTAELARAAGAEVVFEPVNKIARARNAGAAKASGRYLVFVDADSELPPALLSQALARLEEGWSWGGAEIELDAPLTGFHRAAFAGLTRFMRGMKIPAGCFIFCRRDDFTAAGGFDERVYATEEIYFSRAMKRRARREGRGYGILREPKMRSSARKLSWFGSLELCVSITLVCFLPFAARSRWFCRHWYDATLTGKSRG